LTTEVPGLKAFGWHLVPTLLNERLKKEWTELPEVAKELYKKIEFLSGLRGAVVVLGPRDVVEIKCANLDIFHLLPTEAQLATNQPSTEETEKTFVVSEPFDFKHLSHQ